MKSAFAALATVLILPAAAVAAPQAAQTTPSTRPAPAAAPAGAAATLPNTFDAPPAQTPAQTAAPRPAARPAQAQGRADHQRVRLADRRDGAGGPGAPIRGEGEKGGDGHGDAPIDLLRS